MIVLELGRVSAVSAAAGGSGPRACLMTATTTTPHSARTAAATPVATHFAQKPF